MNKGLDHLKNKKNYRSNNAVTKVTIENKVLITE